MSRLLYRSRLFARMRYRLNIHSGGGHTYNKRYFAHLMINALARYLTGIFFTHSPNLQLCWGIPVMGGKVGIELIDLIICGTNYTGAPPCLFVKYRPMHFLLSCLNNGSVSIPPVSYFSVIHVGVHYYILITISPWFPALHSKFCTDKNRVFSRYVTSCRIGQEGQNPWEFT